MGKKKPPRAYPTFGSTHDGDKKRAELQRCDEKGETGRTFHA